MTPARLVQLFEEWSRERRQRGGAGAHWRDVADFFEVSEATVRRWRTAATPVPRAVEVVLEIFHRWPGVTVEGVLQAIAERDAATAVDIS